ncbi:helix-turn-helix domain-containing protein [Halomonas sp.]|jgi:transcriptional regulator with XRE-family HTH domain|uniref:helix-turn-helix domain-containing protein n=1 Tax=Halomonas sp. TaxID=1486246 RepID=UPI003565EA9C
MDSLGPRIKALRLEVNLNKAALARRVGVSDVTISYWESGAIKQIGHERLVALAQALECPLSRLIEGDDGGQATPLYLDRQAPAPWLAPTAKAILIPFELVPSQEWEGECYLVTPAPDNTFDFLQAGDLVAIAPTGIFRQPGLYIVDMEGTLGVRRVTQDNNGELRFEGERKEDAGYHGPDSRLVAKLIARWCSTPL